MVLALMGDTVSIEELTQLADKIVEVAIPAISGVTGGTATRRSVPLTSLLPREENLVAVHLAHLAHALQVTTPPSTGTINVSGTRHGGADLLACLQSGNDQASR